MSYRRRKQTIEEDEAQPVEGEQMKASTLAKTALLGGLNLQEGIANGIFLATLGAVVVVVCGRIMGSLFVVAGILYHIIILGWFIYGLTETDPARIVRGQRTVNIMLAVVLVLMAPLYIALIVSFWLHVHIN